VANSQPRRFLRRDPEKVDFDIDCSFVAIAGVNWRCRGEVAS
jgi:hypothetical protein